MIALFACAFPRCRSETALIFRVKIIVVLSQVIACCDAPLANFRVKARSYESDRAGRIMLDQINDGLMHTRRHMPSQIASIAAFNF
jgi:hypothetical protein